MPRQRNRRRMLEPPHFKGYKPYGAPSPQEPPVELLYEEYEAFKWADYYKYSHHEACRHMGISRSTFARIYASARRKMAQALVETRSIITAPGDVTFDENWYLCNDCNTRFTQQQKHKKRFCPSCQSNDLKPITK